MQPLRYLTRHKDREVNVVEGECTNIDPMNKTVEVIGTSSTSIMIWCTHSYKDASEIKGKVSKQTLKYDYLIVGVGAETATFGIPGVKEHACFLKEIWDAQKIRTRVMDSIETANFPGQTPEEVDRLLHMVVVGGGPTGVEYAAELHDFLVEDLTHWFPHLSGKVQITLIEAMKRVLPMFSKQLIDYTEQTFAENKVEILSETMVKKVNEKTIEVEKNGKREEIPYGVLVWAAGNAPRKVVSDLIGTLGKEVQTQRRGLVVDEYLRVKGADGIFSLGDCSATA